MLCAPTHKSWAISSGTAIEGCSAVMGMHSAMEVFIRYLFNLSSICSRIGMQLVVLGKVSGFWVALQTRGPSFPHGWVPVQVFDGVFFIYFSLHLPYIHTLCILKRLHCTHWVWAGWFIHVCYSFLLQVRFSFVIAGAHKWAWRSSSTTVFLMNLADGGSGLCH